MPGHDTNQPDDEKRLISGNAMDNPTYLMAIGEDCEENQLVIHRRKPSPTA